MLFTVLGVIALFLGERNNSSTVSGQEERFDRPEGLVTVSSVTNSDGREIGDWCKDSSLHLEEQINVQIEEPSLEEPVDGQSEKQPPVEPDSVPGEEQPLVEPDSVPGEEQPLVEPDSVPGEEQPLVEPDSVPGEEQPLVEPDSVPGEEQPLVEPDSVPGEEQPLVEPDSVPGEEQPLVEPDSVHGDEKPLVEPDSVPGEEQSLVEPDSVYGDDQPLVEPVDGHSEDTESFSAEPGCSHDDPPNVVSAKPGCKDDVAQGATCQTEGSVPPQPEELKDQDTHIIEINSRHYEIGAKLGKGSYGTVFAGTRLEDGLPVAVKIADFKIERYIFVPGFNHPLPAEIALHFLATKGPKVKELVQLLDWKVEDNRYFMVLERPIPSVSVTEFLRSHRGNIEEDVLQKIMFHTTIAADTCIKRGVLHRDIKPDNLLMNPQTNEVKLIDFGCGDLMKYYYTTYLGTFQFSPPEAKTAGYYYAEPATVWSLGILQYVLMFKKFPDNHDLLKLNDRNLHQHGRSKECSDFISGCLQTLPWSRYKLNALRAHDWFKRIVKKI
ncbi:pim proto-oncogene, serine/threonine kinase, related 136 isoform X1 [Danio rerio]|uniref:non-specific serine/threonine protein kinase n=1 Tax=Danio rerio TaxID=7955 RepID=A0AB32T993_DANRE